MKKKSYPILLLFAVFLFSFSIVDPFIATRSYSELENRYLKQRPKLKWSQVVKGQFSQDYESYLNDQFVLRDQWISLKSIGETVLMKVENNGIVYGTDGNLYEKYLSYDAERLEKNLGYLSEILEKYPQAKLAAIPSSYEVYRDKLPTGLQQVEQRPLIDAIDVRFPGQTIDLCTPLDSNRDKGLFYRTDHHWTTEGAYYAYKAICASLEKTPVALESLKRIDVPEFYGTFYNKSKKVTAEPDTLFYYELPVGNVTIDGNPVDSWLDESYLDKRDKYAAFLRGNNGHTVLEGVGEGKILLVKDSFSNCMAPFFTENYAEVHIVDLRSFPQGMQQLLEEEQFDDILIIYHFMNLASDTNLYRINY